MTVIGSVTLLIDVQLVVIIFFLDLVVISWRAKKQLVRSCSSAEAEYMTLAYSFCEVLWLQNILEELTIPVQTTPLFSDNKVAVGLTVNMVFHTRTKHIEIDVVREKITFRFNQCYSSCFKGEPC